MSYEPEAIADIVAGLVERTGLPPGLRVRIDVDESSALQAATLRSVEPVILAVDSGALEDHRRPRRLSAGATTEVVGRLLLLARDRLDPLFGHPPGALSLAPAHAGAWDAYAAGRLVRLGCRHFDDRQRQLYYFRCCHGFSDAADAAFAGLWDAKRLSWADITVISDAVSGRVSSATGDSVTDQRTQPTTARARLGRLKPSRPTGRKRTEP
ncbi:hypothetical protein BH18ACT4_BH18ACT4_16020 [soil metagenome]